MTSVARDLLQQIIEPVVVSQGLDLEELDLSRAGRRSRLRVVVDADDGVDLDRCAEVSRLVSKTLDESDAMGDVPYTLEVSSPGVSRPLTRPRHWSRAVGRLVLVKRADGDDVTGRVLSADPHAAVLDVDGERHEVAYDGVRRARVQVEFGQSDESEGSE